jgi:hypothetical protein
LALIPNTRIRPVVAPRQIAGAALAFDRSCSPSDIAVRFN